MFVSMPDAAAFLGEWALRATLLLTIAAGAAACARRASAALRHAVWTAAIAGVIAMPLFGVASAASPLQVPGLHFVTSSVPPAMHVVWSGKGAVPGFSAVPSAGGADAGAAKGDGGPGVHERSRTRAAVGFWIGWVWMGGSLVGVALLLVGYVRAVRLARSGTPVTAPEVLRRLEQASTSLGVHAGVALIARRDMAVPGVMGIFRASIIVPADLIGWPAERQRAAFLHELAHVRRRDCLSQLLAQVACALLWPTPMVWYAARQSRAEREHACDDVVLTTGVAPVTYADVLLDTARRAGGRETPLPVLAMARRSQLEGRLLAILDARRGLRRSSLSSRVAVALLVFGAAVPLAAVAPLPDVGAARDVQVAAAGPAVPMPVEKEPSEARSALPAGSASLSDSIRAVVTARHGDTQLMLAEREIVALATRVEPEPSAVRSALPAESANLPDSVRAVVTARDADTQLMLTEREIVFTFTRAGVERIARQVERSRGASAWNADASSRSGPIAGVANMRMAFPLATVSAVVADEGALELRRQPGTGSSRPFRFEGVDPTDARRFVAAFERHRGAR
ncbi:MAG: M56 family metallopeptidase [Gemmatimonadetes bacterium]|nr:M56 family metallopeptidase [Gemmatimonadota bacterium]